MIVSAVPNKITFSALEKLRYVKSFKKALQYKYKASANNNNSVDCRMTWSIATRPLNITTMLDGKETSNKANHGDFVLCGPRGERYVVRMEKIGQLYERSKEDPSVLIVKRGDKPRMVAEYTGVDGVFKASWGEMMKLNTGDFVVREDKNKFYRVERSVFHETYEIKK
jgi:hypothetical protein